MHSFWQKAGAEFAAALQADGMAVGPGVFLNDFSAGDKFEVMEKLGEISLAVLAVVGTEDVMAPVMYAQLMVEKMQNANIASIEGGAQSVPSGVPG